MRASLSVAALLIAVAASAQSPTPPPLTSPASALGAPWAYLAGSFVALAEAMPAEKYGFVPTTGEFTGVRSFGEQVKHVACANFAFFNQIEGKTPPADCANGGPHPARTRDELVQYLRDSFAYGSQVQASLSEKSLFEVGEGPYGGRRTKLGMATMAMWHASDHYGQLVVYLRSNGIVPPASRR